jgi:hypothetical protein
MSAIFDLTNVDKIYSLERVIYMSSQMFMQQMCTEEMTILKKATCFANAVDSILLTSI